MVHWLLIAAASLILGRGLQGVWASAVAALGLSSCGTWALVAPTHVESSQTRD